jgi:hypothetical protein
MISCVRRAPDRLPGNEADWFMMGNSITQLIDPCQLIEDISLVVLKRDRTHRLTRKYSQKRSPGSGKLVRSKHIAPESKAKFGDELMMAIPVVQFLNSLIDIGSRHAAISGSKDAPFLCAIFQPIVAK